MTLAEFRALVQSDYSVNQSSSGLFGFLTVLVLRTGQYGKFGVGLLPRFARGVYIVANLVWTKSVVGSDIPVIRCGEALCLPHGGRGLFINSGTILGSYVTIQQQVTIGNRPPDRRAPTIGSNVQLGAKSSVLGSVKVGDGARVGAHALVLHDVAPDDTVVGVPAVRRL